MFLKISKQRQLQDDKNKLTTLSFKYRLLLEAVLSHYTCLGYRSKFLWSVNSNMKLKKVMRSTVV